MIATRVIRNWKSPTAFVRPSGEFVQNPMGPGRRYLFFVDVPLTKEAFSAFGFTAFEPYKRLPNFVGSHYQDGAFTHEHTDAAPYGFVHVRCNWMLKKPKEGGDPILSGEVVPVEEGDLWVCFASREKHASTPIFGGERVICSFGGLVRTEDMQVVA